MNPMVPGRTSPNGIVEPIHVVIPMPPRATARAINARPGSAIRNPGAPVNRDSRRRGIGVAGPGGVFTSTTSS